ncbi:MAG TPA: diaminopimelate decarboxylase [Myxococcales bacterium]|nr:diaminopimelate decarboxylase [Myxococcales bacterium]
MNHFHLHKGELHAEDVPLRAIAEQVGTPTYVYSRATLVRHFDVISAAFKDRPHLLCYSVKSSSNLALLHLFANLGSGFDIVSGGELARVLEAKGEVSRVVFSGVGKTREEMARAHRAGILLFNVESAEELELLDAVGREAGRPAPFAVRVNPDVNARTHRHISTGLRTSKFGVPFAEAAALYERSRRMKGVVARGVDCHIGSQLTSLAPLEQALRKVAELAAGLAARGHQVAFVDVGGGLGIVYRDERPPSPVEYAKAVARATAATGATVILEPGRVITGNAGMLLTRVIVRKRTPARTFVVVDAGMNDLVRPALYDAFHDVQPVKRRRGRAVAVDLVGPVCESSDVLGRGRKMVLPEQGELLAVASAGAYGMCMASNYNSRPRPAEVLVEGASFRVIRRREKPEDLWRGEAL